MCPSGFSATRVVATGACPLAVGGSRGPTSQSRAPSPGPLQAWHLTACGMGLRVGSALTPSSPRVSLEGSILV